MSRRRFSEREVIETLIRQGVTIGCYRCHRIFEALECRDRTIEREHIIEIALGGQDYATNCAYSHKDCHAKITNGTKATTAGSSKQRIAKVKRLTGVTKGRSKTVWPKGHRKMQSRPFQRKTT